MGIPIELSLKDGKQVALATLQDYVVESLLEAEPNITMHGGTAIWRCYRGNRFSEDIDIYASDSQMKRIHHYLTWGLSKRGVRMDYPKGSGRTITVWNEFGRTKLEAMMPPKNLRPVEREFERVNGSKFFISTLSISDFMLEKESTYQKRGYVRDLYDLYHLASLEKPDPKTSKAIKKFIDGIEKPIDETKLKDLVYSGRAPSFNTMVDYISGRLE